MGGFLKNSCRHYSSLLRILPERCSYGEWFWQLLSRQKSCWHQWKFGPIKGLRIRSAGWHEEGEEIQKRQWQVRISQWLTGKWRSYPVRESAPKARYVALSRDEEGEVWNFLQKRRIHKGLYSIRKGRDKNLPPRGERERGWGITQRTME